MNALPNPEVFHTSAKLCHWGFVGQDKKLVAWMGVFKAVITIQSIGNTKRMEIKIKTR
jgi:hypothetical protein